MPKSFQPHQYDSTTNLREQEEFEAKQHIIYLIKKKKHSQAINELKEWSYHAERWNSEEMYEFYWPQLAYCYLQANDLYKARQTANLILEEKPHDSTTLLMLAYLDLFEANTSKSIYRYTELLKNPYAQKRAKTILKAIAKSKTPSGLLKKKLSFFYQHPSHLLSPKITEPRRWIKERIRKKKIDFKHFVSFKRVSTLLLISGGLYWATTQVYEQWLQSPPPTLIEVEIKKGSSWGQLYQRMEEAIKQKDMNRAIITYNQAQIKKIPKELEGYFNYLYHFTVTPELESLPLVRSFTHLRLNPDLYLQTFIKLKGNLSLLANQNKKNKRKTQYLYLPDRPINEKIIINFNNDANLSSLFFQKRQPYEILTRLEHVEGNTVYLKAISTRVLTKNSR